MKKIKSRAGFSLVSVLIISVVSMAIMGGISYMFSSYAGSSRVTIAQGQVYNMLQEGIEQGKAFLRENMTKSHKSMSGDVAPLRWNTGLSSNEITDPDDLLIRDRQGTRIGMLVDGKPVSVGGVPYTYSLRIFDMMYSGAVININDDESEKKANMPPAMSFVATSSGTETNPLDPDDGGSSVTNAGIYLVRATLTPVGAGNVRLIETAVVQAIDDK